MKKSTVAIIVIVLVIIFGTMYYLHVDVSRKVFNQTISTAEGMMKINSRLSEIEEELGMHETNQDDNELDEPIKDDVQFDSNKMKSDSTSVVYEETTLDYSCGLNIEIKDGKPYLSTDVEDEQYKFLFEDVKEKLENKELTGFKTNVKDVYYAYMGNGDMCPIILFLMEDGTVEYADSGKILKNKNYKSSGKIEELSNIVKFVELNAMEIDENGEGLSGWVTCAAIDKDGYSFDLSQSKSIK